MSETKSYDARKKKVEDLRKRFPGKRISLVVTQGKEYYIRNPDRAEWHNFKDSVGDNKKYRVAMENLAVSCVLDPGPEVVRNLLDTTDPALAEVLAGKIAILGGYDETAEMIDFPEP